MIEFSIDEGCVICMSASSPSLSCFGLFTVITMFGLFFSAITICGLFSVLISSALFIFGSINHLFIHLHGVIGCTVDIVVIIFSYPSSIAIYEAISKQVRLQMCTNKGVQPDALFAFSTRT